jgi:hypothetical protein
VGGAQTSKKLSDPTEMLFKTPVGVLSVVRSWKDTIAIAREKVRIPFTSRPYHAGIHHLVGSSFGPRRSRQMVRSLEAVAIRVRMLQTQSMIAREDYAVR